MNIYDFTDYRALIRAQMKALPKQGYGQLGRLAEHLGVNSTLISQILGGAKNLSEDQGYKTCEFFQLNEQETYYFLLLVQRERAGNHKLRALLEKRIHLVQREANRVKNRLSPEKELTFEQQAVFYSSWLYTAVHAMSSIERFQSVEKIADHLQISRPRILEIAEWLVQNGFCKNEGGNLVIGPVSTFVDRDSPLAPRHHANWRQKGLERMADQSESNFFFTAPFTVSDKDFQELRKELVQLIDRVSKRVEKSEPEFLAAINIDFFKS